MPTTTQQRQVDAHSCFMLELSLRLKVAANSAQTRTLGTPQLITSVNSTYVMTAVPYEIVLCYACHCTLAKQALRNEQKQIP